MIPYYDSKKQECDQESIIEENDLMKYYSNNNLKNVPNIGFSNDCIQSNNDEQRYNSDENTEQRHNPENPNDLNAYFFGTEDNMPNLPLFDQKDNDDYDEEKYDSDSEDEMHPKNPNNQKNQIPNKENEVFSWNFENLENQILNKEEYNDEKYNNEHKMRENPNKILNHNSEDDNSEKKLSIKELAHKIVYFLSKYDYTSIEIHGGDTNNTKIIKIDNKWIIDHRYRSRTLMKTIIDFIQKENKKYIMIFISKYSKSMQIPKYQRHNFNVIEESLEQININEITKNTWIKYVSKSKISLGGIIINKGQTMPCEYTLSGQKIIPNNEILSKDILDKLMQTKKFTISNRDAVNKKISVNYIENENGNNYVIIKIPQITDFIRKITLQLIKEFEKLKLLKIIVFICETTGVNSLTTCLSRKGFKVIKCENEKISIEQLDTRQIIIYKGYITITKDSNGTIFETHSRIRDTSCTKISYPNGQGIIISPKIDAEEIENEK